MARRTDILPFAAAVALAALLALLSVPSLVAAMMARTSDADMEYLREGRQLRPADIEAAAAGQAGAARLFESARYNSNAATALLMLTPADRLRTKMDAEELVNRALAAAPASPHNWLKLAYLRAVKGDRKGAIAAWKMSVLTGRYVPNLMTDRLTLAFYFYPTDDNDFVSLISDQVNLAAELDMPGLVEAARRRGVEPYVRVMLWADTDRWKAFRREYGGLLWRERHRHK